MAADLKPNTHRCHKTQQLTQTGIGHALYIGVVSVSQEILMHGRFVEGRVTLTVHTRTHTHTMRSLWMRQAARDTIEEDSVVNGDSCAEYVIFHSDRQFSDAYTHTHTPCSVLGRQNKTDYEPSVCFREEYERENITLWIWMCLVINK